VDQPKYRNWTTEAKLRADRDEKLLVRPYPEENAICRCPSPEEAAWVAQRLNRASLLEGVLENDILSAIDDCIDLGMDARSTREVIKATVAKALQS